MARVFALLFLTTAAFAQPPAVVPGGIVNAASQMPTSLSGGKLAPGARIKISGIRFVDPNSETTLRLAQGEWSASIKPNSTNDTTLEAILPADTPSGEIGISVTNGQGSSRAEIVPIAASSPGIASLNGEGWGPATRDAVRAGQQVTLLVNGLNEPRPKVLVAGLEAHGVKVKGAQLNFEVPHNVPLGCWTPVWIQSQSGDLSNFVTISTRRGREPCEQIPGWFARQVAAGTRTGLVVFQRIRGSVEERGTPQKFQFDSAAGFFFRAAAGDLSPLQLLPPASSCTTYTGVFKFDATVLVQIPRFIGASDQMLDLGTSFTVTDGRGRQDSLYLSNGARGFYTALFGGTLPIMWGPGTPLFLEPGSFQIRSEASDEIGKLDMAVTVPQPFVWVNKASLDTIDRHEGMQLEWSNLGPDRQMVGIAFNIDQYTSALGSAVCVAPPGATQMKIPAYALANFPPTRPVSSLPLRFVLLASIPASAPLQPLPRGLDDARAIFMEVEGKSVRYR